MIEEARDYLEDRFVPRAMFCEIAEVDEREFARQLDGHLVPSPSYTVAGNMLRSAAFGDLGLTDAADGEYFPPDAQAWVRKASELTAANREQATQAMRQAFVEELTVALSEWNRNQWRLPDSFDDAGFGIQAGLDGRQNGFWQAHLAGIFGVCVARSASIEAIVEKELLQERLAAITANGTRRDYDDEDRCVVTALVDRYERASMPFSPPEYPRSSRKRLVEDVRRLLAS